MAHGLAEKISSHKEFDIISDKEGVPLVVWTVAKDAGFDVFQVSDVLRKYGWIVPAYTMPTGCSKSVLRVVVRESFSRTMMEDFYCDLVRAVDELSKSKSKTVGTQASLRC